MNAIRASFCCAAALLLTACASRPPVTDAIPEARWIEHRERVIALSEWKLMGRVAIRNDEDGWNAGFDWHQVEDRYRIRLRGPFGQGAVELRGDSAGVWLTRGDSPAVFARDAEALLLRETGWRLPLSGLTAWLRGVPQEAPVTTLAWDAEGRLSELAQSGWQIDYRRYQAVAGRQLPDRLAMVRDGLRVKVVIDQWQLP